MDKHHRSTPSPSDSTNTTSSSAPRELPEKITSLISEGLFEQGTRVLEQADTRAVVDAAFHQKLAVLAEELGMLERAVFEYNLSLRDDSKQPGVILRLARLRRDQGDGERAFRAYGRLLLLEPGDVTARLEAGEVLEELGRYGDSVKLLRAGLAHGENERLRAALRRLSKVGGGGGWFVESGRDVSEGSHGSHDRAQFTADESSGVGVGVWGGEQSRRDVPQEVLSQVREAPQVDRADHLLPDQVDLVQFSSLFTGREGFYARQWVSSSGKHGYTPIAEPFTPHVARGHLLGNHTVGIYPVRMDHSVLFLALDVDIAKFALGRWGSSRAMSRKGSPLPDHPMLRFAHQVAVGLARSAASMGISAYLEDSGRKGRHVWIFFESPIPAVAARRLGNAIIAGSTVPCPPEITIEVFPKQNRVERDGGLGNLIKLPLGIHRVSGRRSLFLDVTGRPFRDQLVHLRSIKRLSREVAADLLREISIADTPPIAPGKSGAPYKAVGERLAAGAAVSGQMGGYPPGVLDELDDFPSTHELEEFFHDPDKTESGQQGRGFGHIPDAPPRAELPSYNIDDDEEFLWLMQKCPVIALIVRRVREDRMLPNPCRLVVTYTVGHLSTGPQAVNTILSLALNMDRSLFLKSPLKGNPMSCPKIRSHLAGMAGSVECNCRFDMRDGMYPTPLLHLQSLRLRGTVGADPRDLGMLQVERMVSDLFRLRGEIERSERLARQIEVKLVEVMDEHQVRELSVPSGVLRLQPVSGEEGRDALVLGLPGESSTMDGGTVGVTGNGGMSTDRQARGGVGEISVTKQSE